MSKILWISLNAAYDKVGHAGGKSENFYQKNLKKANDDLRILSFALEHEREKMDLDDYGIENEIKYYPDDFSRVLKMIDIYFYSMKAIRRYKKEGYEPDIIILQWTQMAFLIGYIKMFFPKAKYIVIEEDVAFLSYKRFSEYHTNLIKKILYKCAYWAVKFMELRSVKKSDITICNNKKDIKLLTDAGISAEKIRCCIPYYQDLSKLNFTGDSHDVIYYGAMGRPENHKSALWFIENVMPLLSHLDVRFAVIGGGVPESLHAHESDKIKFLGFVDDPGVYFQSALCMAAPLVLGAGIKVKVLEAMSAGLPVLTNEIGIEGIPAVDGRDYFFAEEAERYAEAIEILLKDKKAQMEMSASAKRFMEQEFNLETNRKNFLSIIEELAEK